MTQSSDNEHLGVGQLFDFVITSGSGFLKFSKNWWVSS
jgi:hypothetical protein